MALYLKHHNTEFKVGDTVKVHQKIVEGEKSRIQVFEGLVISAKGHDGEKTFTIRKITAGIGVERIFPIDSPFISKITLSKKGKVRRAKLYYLRSRTGRLALKVRQDFDKTDLNGDKKNAKKSTKKDAGEKGRAADKKEAPTE